MVLIYRFYFLESVHICAGSATLDSYLKKGLDKMQKNCSKTLCRFALQSTQLQGGGGGSGWDWRTTAKSTECDMPAKALGQTWFFQGDWAHRAQRQVCSIPAYARGQNWFWSHSIHWAKEKKRFYTNKLKYFYGPSEKCKAFYCVNS